MKVIVAKSAGFCFGVKRAVEKVYELIEQGENGVYTLGPIIHNEKVVAELEEKGVYSLDSLDSLDKDKIKKIVIRSHGVPSSVYDVLNEADISYLDVTCPFVKKIHKLAHNNSQDGRHIIVIGSAIHPEVQGICGWIPGDYTVIENKSEAEALNLPEDTKICIVSQTTFNYNKFQELVEIISKKGYDKIVINTICNATEERQTEAREIAKSVDAMIVIGGKHSSNTQKLFEICKKECENTYYIQTLDDLDLNAFRSTSCVGITAGASTPNNLIEEVSKHVRNEF